MELKKHIGFAYENLVQRQKVSFRVKTDIKAQKTYIYE